MSRSSNDAATRRYKWWGILQFILLKLTRNRLLFHFPAFTKPGCLYKFSYGCGKQKTLMRAQSFRLQISAHGTITQNEILVDPIELSLRRNMLNIECITTENIVIKIIHHFYSSFFVKDKITWTKIWIPAVDIRSFDMPVDCSPLRNNENYRDFNFGEKNYSFWKFFISKNLLTRPPLCSILWLMLFLGRFEAIYLRFFNSSDFTKRRAAGEFDLCAWDFEYLIWMPWMLRYDLGGFSVRRRLANGSPEKDLRRICESIVNRSESSSPQQLLKKHFKLDAYQGMTWKEFTWHQCNGWLIHITYLFRSKVPRGLITNHKLHTSGRLQAACTSRRITMTRFAVNELARYVVIVSLFCWCVWLQSVCWCAEP